MDGMEKITARIREDADRELETLNAQTDRQIADLQAQAQAQQASQQQANAGAGAQGDQKKDDVVDAEFEEVKDDKK